MGPIYATRLVVFSDALHPAETLYDQGVRICHGWLRKVASRHGITLPEDHTIDYASARTEQGSHFSVDHLRIESATAWRAIGAHPFDNNRDGLQLRFEVQVRYSGGGELVITIRLLLGFAYDSIRPLRYRIHPPRLILQLLDAFPNLVSNGNMRASQQVSHPTVDEMVELREHIFDHSRLIPLVVVSRLENEGLMFPPEILNRIALNLAGLARVFVLPTFDSGFFMSTHLTKELSCYLGALRIYWPGFSVSDSPFRHPLFTAARILDERLWLTMPDYLFETISTASANSIGPDEETARMYRSFTASKQEEATTSLLKRLSDAATALESEKESKQVAEELFNDAASKISALSTESAEFLDEIERMEDEIHQLRARTEAQNRHLRQANDQADVVQLISRSASLRSVDEVVAFVNQLADENALVILPTAMESAKSCSFSGDMSSVLGLLLTIVRVSNRYHAGDSLGHKKLFEAEGDPGYRANVSETAQRLHRTDYERTYRTSRGAETILLGPHLSIGSGSPTSSVGVYWYVDQETRRYVIGHIGRHLSGKRAT